MLSENSPGMKEASMKGKTLNAKWIISLNKFQNLFMKDVVN